MRILHSAVAPTIAFAVLLGTCEPPSETLYDGVDFTLTCEPVEPDLVGTGLEIQTNETTLTSSRDILTLEPRDAFAYRRRTGCGNGYDYDAAWFLARRDDMSAQREREIVEQVAPFS
jgi:hypothetical protein